MWEFRPIGKYYELLVDGDSIYLCRKQDTIIQSVIEDLCNRHNNQVRELLDEAYNNGYDDGYDIGYNNAIEDMEGGE